MLEKIKTWAVGILGFIATIALLLLNRSQQKSKELDLALKATKLDKEIENDLENGRKALDEYTGSRLTYDEWKRKYRPAKSG